MFDHHVNALDGVTASGASKGPVLGPCPNTLEEKAAAAKKYNLTLNDYEAYPDKGEGSVLISTILTCCSSLKMHFKVIIVNHFAYMCGVLQVRRLS